MKKRTKKLLSVCCSALEAADKLEISAAIFTEALVMGCFCRCDVGKRRAPARMNIFDCFAYALAREQDARLPCVGNNLTRTDVASALPPAN